MTPEQQNVAIAQACGWTEIVITPNDPMPPKGRECKGANWGKPLPDYTGSLDAMHEAEKTLRGQQCNDYADILEDGNGGHFATAAQRAEAFLRTIGKRTE